VDKRPRRRRHVPLSTPRRPHPSYHFTARLHGQTARPIIGRDAIRQGTDIQSKCLYFDPAESRQALGYGQGGIVEAIEKTVKACL
jgi:hypothetical protein